MAIARLEAVLFLAREPLSSRKLAQIAGLADGTAARTLIRRLNRLYDIAGQAFRVIEIAGGYQLLTKPEFAPVLRKIVQVAKRVAPFRHRRWKHWLSWHIGSRFCGRKWKQSVAFSATTCCGSYWNEIWCELLVVRRTWGDRLLYGTTKRFLELFGLRSLEELPRAAELQPVVNHLGR